MSIEKQVRDQPAIVRLLRSSTAGAIGVALFLLILLGAVLAGVLTPYDPTIHSPDRLAPPSGAHWMGTDEFGRDILTRILHGTRVSLLVAVVAVLFGASVGIITGLVAGYFRGWLENLIMRAWDLFIAFPGILLAIAVLTVVGTGTAEVAFVIGLGAMPVFARLVRSLTLKERELDYVKASRILGAGDLRIMFWHILPNVLPAVIIQASIVMATAVLAESALSFLGFGAQPPTPTLGNMLQAGQGFLQMAPWYGVFPGVAITMLVFSLFYVSDALLAVLNPRKQSAE